MRKTAPLTTMLSSLALVAAVSAFFHLRSRPTILEAFAMYATELPRSARVALSAWFLPSFVGGAVVVAMIGLLIPRRPRARNVIVGTALFVAAIALLVAVWAGFFPVFQPER